MDSSLLKLADNNITLNELDFMIGGFIKQNQDSSTSINLDFKTPKNDLKQLISLIPGAYQVHFNDLNVAGVFQCEGQIKGIYNSKTNEQPRISLKSSIADGSVKYNHLPYPIQNINLNLAVRSLDSFGTTYKIEIPNYSFSIEQDPVEGKLNIVQSQNGLAIQGASKGLINLNTLQKAIPWDSLRMSGQLAFDTQFDFTKSQILKKEYNKIKLAGTLDASQIKVNSPLFMPFDASHIKVLLDPQNSQVQLENGHYGKSDLTGQMKLINPLALIIGSYEKTDLDIQSKSKLLDINEMIAYNNRVSVSTVPIHKNESIVTKLRMTLNASAGKVVYKDYQISTVSFIGKYLRDTLIMQHLDLLLNGSKMGIEGKLNHPYNWSNSDKLLTGNIAISSTQFNLDPWMKEDAPSNDASGKDSVFIKNLPERTDLQLTAQFGQLSYGSYLFKGIKGDARLNNQSLELYHGSGNLYNGNVSINGVYQESDALPQYNFKVDLNNLKIEEFFKTSKTFSSLVPIAAFLEGTFSSSLITSGMLNASFSPVWNSIDASGIFETFHGLFSKFKPLEDLANKIQIPLISRINWEKSRNYFDIEDGTVTIKPFEIKSGEISIQAGGTHHLSQNMNYNLLFSIPRTLFDKYKIGLAINSKLEWLRSQISKKGITLASLDTIYIMANIQGSLSKPVLNITWVQHPNSGSVAQQIQDELSKEIKDKIDSVKAVATDKINEKKDSLIKILKEDINLKKAQVG
jgi:hypothetical protein